MTPTKHDLLSRITPLILTLNEERNIGRTLEKLSWAKDVVVLDSLSTDATVAIVSGFRNARVFTRAFTTHAEQWEFGRTATGIRTEWVLALDADYVLTDELVGELSNLNPPDEVAGYSASFLYCIDGIRLRGGIYPPVTVLYRRAKAVYIQEGHTQRVVVSGEVGRLSAPILHDDRKSPEQWRIAQERYMKLEAEKLMRAPFSRLRWRDRLRKLVVVAPVLVLFYCLFVRGNILSGKAGIRYSMQRATAEAILSGMLLRTITRRS